jgi:hypothetical protein
MQSDLFDEEIVHEELCVGASERIRQLESWGYHISMMQRGKGSVLWIITYRVRRRAPLQIWSEPPIRVADYDGPLPDDDPVPF